MVTSMILYTPTVTCGLKTLLEGGLAKYYRAGLRITESAREHNS